MSKLYNNLAEVYEAMYHTFIDYEDQFKLYGGILNKYGKKSVLEIGCGTGNLGKYFVQNDIDYLGMDLSPKMIKIAKSKNPECSFFEGNMIDFELEKNKESAIITARTISYLTKTKSINSAFSSINKNLKKGGILSFDFIDANQFLLEIGHGQNIEHSAFYEGVEYKRKTFWRGNFEDGMDVYWKSNYYKKEGTNWIELGENEEIIRTFTLNEMELLLRFNGYQIVEVRKRATYAFPTFVMVAQKK